MSAVRQSAAPRIAQRPRYQRTREREYHSDHAGTRSFVSDSLITMRFHDLGVIAAGFAWNYIKAQLKPFATPPLPSFLLRPATDLGDLDCMSREFDQGSLVGRSKSNSHLPARKNEAFTAAWANDAEC